MNEENFNLKKDIIKYTFKDEHEIVEEISMQELDLPPHLYEGGDLFKTEDGCLVYLEYQRTNFDVDELVKYVELAEELYSKYEKHVSVYILCPANISVSVKECEIKSDADFTIRLVSIENNSADFFLKHIKSQIKKGIPLNEEELEILSNIPMMCDKKYRNYYRKECFKINNQIS